MSRFWNSPRGWIIGGVTLTLLLPVLWYGHSSESGKKFTSNTIATVTGSQHVGDILDTTQNSTLGFEKIFVINLASRTDHRDSMSLAAAFTHLDFEYVEGATNVDPKAVPYPLAQYGAGPGHLGNWRSHMNVARTMVERNISSALVLEDDSDWDIRIKSQMRNLAKASQLLVQPLEGTTDQFLDPSSPVPGTGASHVNIPIDAQGITIPRVSPYGDLNRWDLLWIGHCGAGFPEPGEGTPMGRVVIENDETVPEPQHVQIQFGDGGLKDQYPDHTRVVSRSHNNVCTLAYALSQAGARRLLHDMAIVGHGGPTDSALREACDGSDGKSPLTCLAVIPPLFEHHRPVGSKASFTDISDPTEGINEHAFTHNIRWSTKMNFEQLLAGSTDYFDQYKDGDESHDFGWKR